MNNSKFPKGPGQSGIEQRREPRYKTRLACMVKNASGDSCPGLITNLSSGGFQVAGNFQLMRTVFPHFKRAALNDAIKLSVDFRVPTTDKVAASVHLLSQSVYCRRVRGDWFHIGCQLVELDVESEKVLSNFIQHFAAQHSAVLNGLRPPR
ncbi:PilZ domain-containing protein [Aurantivibrio plasticivorans]